MRSTISIMFLATNPGESEHTFFKGFPGCILFMYRFDTSLKTSDVSIRYIAKIPNVSFRYMPKMLNVSKEYIKHFACPLWKIDYNLGARMEPHPSIGESREILMTSMHSFNTGNVSFWYMECIVSIHVSNRYIANSQSLNVSIRYIEISEIPDVSINTKYVS